MSTAEQYHASRKAAKARKEAAKYKDGMGKERAAMARKISLKKKAALLESSPTSSE